MSSQEQRRIKTRSENLTARYTGILFIIATAAGILNVAALQSILAAPDFLHTISANANQVILGAMLSLIMAAAIFFIPVLLYPVLKKHSEKAAIGYVASRIFEGVPIVFGIVSLLSLVRLSQDFVLAGAADAATLQAIGRLLLIVIDVTDLTGTQIIFSITALILNYSLYQSKIVPRFISVWGLIGVPLMFAAGLLSVFGVISTFSMIAIIMYVPLAVQEMVFAVWLIVKGFRIEAE